MRALVYTPDAPAGLRQAEVPEPATAPDEVLVAVASISLNSGEVRHLSQMRQPGEIPGWDAAGTVLRAAADGSGPAVGSRVVTFGWDGAWAQRRAASVSELAVVPDEVDLGAASALPVAAVTALRAVRRLGPLLGKRVLVTGASGGVGRFAVQLAALGGAEVIAAVGSPQRGEGLSELGAAEVVVGLDDVDPPLGAILDNVGGELLATAYGLLEPDGTAIAIGSPSGNSVTLDLEAARRRGGGTALIALSRGGDSAEDLSYLVGLLAVGRLDPQIGWRGSWDDVYAATEALLSRKVAGKAVLDL
jgi:NADPH2:quinone reductase